ncbi:hypothetical protein, partial [Sansalvadorimonas verongulae]|uniref:hypothetical protein n=1 Tax=Sansalvadorimonas verongulae TaxID=2172824 RepID=UPI001E632374
MNPEKMAALAKALRISQEELIGSVQSGTALPASATSALNVDDIVKELWEQEPDSDAFILGSELLKSEDKPDINGCYLLGSWFGSESSLAQGVGALVRRDKPVDFVLQELQDLHEKMVHSGLVGRDDWQYTIVWILTRACKSLGVHSPQFIAIARVAIQQNWLEPENCPDREARTLHDLLKKMGAVNEFKSSVQRRLKNWYAHSFAKKRDQNSCIRKILCAASPLALPMYSGHSSTLE